jgi:sugar phosphate isomerase/epimerase
MQLAFSTNAYVRHSLRDAMERLRAIGYRAVEILADKPHAFPGDLDAKRISEIAGDVQRLGLKVSNVNANCSFGYFREAPPEAVFEPSLISENRAWREDRLRLIGKTLELAKAVGASCISITSGKLLGGVGPEKAQQLWREGIGRVLEMADQFGVNVGIECEPGLFVEYCAELRHWIDELGHPRLGANLDLGHSHVMGEDLGTVLRLLRGRIWNLHIEDLPGRKHYHLPPGEGTMDWPAIMAALQAIDYQGFATIELYPHVADPDGVARRSLEFLRQAGWD